MLLHTLNFELLQSCFLLYLFILQFHSTFRLIMFILLKSEILHMRFIFRIESVAPSSRRIFVTISIFISEVVVSFYHDHNHQTITLFAVITSYRYTLFAKLAPNYQSLFFNSFVIHADMINSSALSIVRVNTSNFLLQLLQQHIQILRLKIV